MRGWSCGAVWVAWRGCRGVLERVVGVREESAGESGGALFAAYVEEACVEGRGLMGRWREEDGEESPKEGRVG